MARHPLRRPEASQVAAPSIEVTLAEAYQVKLDAHIAGLAGVLNECLSMLDELGMGPAAIHLSAAIEALPGQAALLPANIQDLVN